MATRFNRFYTTELARLRANSLEFAQANPAVAPMLGTVSTDPDIERLLEGVAFLNGLTLQKLDDEFPEIVQELASILVPQFLRPLPSASMVAFEPKTRLPDTAVIPAGTEIGSTPVNGVSCRFHTTANVYAHSVTLTRLTTEQLNDGTHALRLHLQGGSDANGLVVPEKLRFFLGEDQAVAANVFMLLATQVKSVNLIDRSGQRVSLSSRLVFPAFDEPMLPYPDNAFPAFGWLQELLFFPQKFLFFEVQDIHKGKDVLLDEQFSLEIVFFKTSIPLDDLSIRNFVLNVAPVVNLFPFESEPINLTHEMAEYLVVPSGAHKAHYQIYSINAVSGYVQGQAGSKNYIPFSLLTQSGESLQASYRTSIRPSMIGDTVDTYLSVVYPPGSVQESETLSLSLTCTNRHLAENLKLGDICKPTSSSPERFTFRNITPVTVSIDPPSGEKLLWDVISHTTLNLLSLSNIDNLRGMLRLYNATCTQTRSVRTANERQIDGLSHLSITREMRLVRGSMMQGQHIVLTCEEKNWASPGVLYLWGCVLDRFLSCYAAVNSYTRFEIHDKNTGTEFKWPIRMGQQLLL